MHDVEGAYLPDAGQGDCRPPTPAEPAADGGDAELRRVNEVLRAACAHFRHEIGPTLPNHPWPW